MSSKSTMLKKWFLWSRSLRNHVITDNFGNLNCLWNIPIADLGCLTCLLQSMVKIIQEEISKESKLVKALLHSGIGGHCDRWIKLSGDLKRCYNNQWPLNNRYFKCCIYVIYIYNQKNQKNQKNSEILLNKNNKCLFSYLYNYIYKYINM